LTLFDKLSRPLRKAKPAGRGIGKMGYLGRMPGTAITVMAQGKAGAMLGQCADKSFALHPLKKYD
jgi:hypothetical protein